MAANLNNLANVYYDQGRHGEAEPLYQQAIAIMKKKFLGGHPYLDIYQDNYDSLKQEMTEQQQSAAPNEENHV